MATYKCATCEFKTNSYQEAWAHESDYCPWINEVEDEES